MIKKVGDWLHPKDAGRGHHKAAFHDGANARESGGEKAVFFFCLTHLCVMCVGF